jgi:hypothetical protein
MIRLPLIVSAFLLAAASDTVWWRSDAGTVIGHRSGEAVTCTLMLAGDASQLQVSWSTGMPTRAVFERRSWRFQAGNVLDIAVRVGGTWLGHGSGAPNIPAMTGTSALMFVASDDIGSLLKQAADIQIEVGSWQADIAVPPAKMSALMQAADRCRALIAPRS